MIHVAINGYGTIGRRVADAVMLQEDMNVVGISQSCIMSSTVPAALIPAAENVSIAFLSGTNILGTSSQTTFVYNSNTSGINFSLFNQSIVKQMSADPAISINPNYAVFSYLLSAHIPSVFSVEVNGISLQSE